MSTYMEAFNPAGGASSKSQPAMTPPHITGGGPPTGPVYVGNSPSGPVAVPGANANAASASGLYNPAASVVDVPKKSKAGLFIALFAILAVGGGITAVVVMGKGDGKTANGGGSGSSSGSGSGIVAMEKPNAGSGSATSPDPTSKTGGSNGSAAIVANGSAGSAGSATAMIAVADAGIAAPPPPVDAAALVATVTPDAAVAPPPPAGDKVLLDVKNVQTFEVWENGAKLSDDVDFEIIVPPGGKRDLVLKAKGFLDKKISVDGSKHKLMFSLDHVPGVTPPKPPKLDCTNELVHPRDPVCRKQFCARHGGEAQWERKCNIDDD
jgi:hypothetical protein